MTDDDAREHMLAQHRKFNAMYIVPENKGGIMNISKPEPRTTRLPKWARDHIGELERQVSELKKQRDTLTRERTAITPEEAKIGWEVFPHRVNKDIYPIPDYAQVTFKTKCGLIHCDLRQDILNVYAESGTLVVVARGGANVLSIETRD